MNLLLTTISGIAISLPCYPSGRVEKYGLDASCRAQEDEVKRIEVWINGIAIMVHPEDVEE